MPIAEKHRYDTDTKTNNTDKDHDYSNKHRDINKSNKFRNANQTNNQRTRTKQHNETQLLHGCLPAQPGKQACDRECHSAQAFWACHPLVYNCIGITLECTRDGHMCVDSIRMTPFP